MKSFLERVKQGIDIGVRAKSSRRGVKDVYKSACKKEKQNAKKLRKAARKRHKA